MRQLGFLLAVSMAHMSSSATAQTATLRSGEHLDFTRVVAPIPPGADWSVTHEESIVTLSVPAFDGTFDLSQLFTLVPRDRIKSAESSAGSVSFTLGCDCKVAPFLTDGRFVVLDFSAQDVVLEANAVEKTVLDATSADTVTAAFQETGFDEVEVGSADPVEPIKLPIVTAQGAQPDLPELAPLDLPLRARKLPRQENLQNLNEIQKRLAKELSTAATRGILTPVPNLSEPQTVTLQALDNLVKKEEMHLAQEQEERSVPAANNLRVTSSSDLPVELQRSIDALADTGRNCPTNDDIPIASWASDKPFHLLIGDARTNLFAEFDRLNPESLTTLARTYVYFGFGAEALQVIRLDPKVAQKEHILADIANIMENGRALKDSELGTLIDCESDIVLWAILAEPDAQVGPELDASSALLALNKLPLHLRRFLAPALSERLLSFGDPAAATAALRNVERLPDALPSASKLARAKLSINQGKLPEATETLEDVIDDNTVQSPEALIELVETHLEKNQPIDPKIAGLIEAYAKELRGSILGPELRRAHVLALIKSGQFDRAFAAADELGGGEDTVAASELRTSVSQEVIANAPDVIFLEHFFRQQPREIGLLPEGPKLALATRLVALGFPGQAESVTSMTSRRPTNPKRQILQGRSALQLDRPQDALAAISEVEGDDADLLRAQASLASGAHQQAYELYRNANSGPDATIAAWLGGSETSGALRNDPVFGPILALQNAPAQAATETDGMLRRSIAALNESTDARRAISQLLADRAIEVTNRPQQ